MILLPYPRVLKRTPGFCVVPRKATVNMDTDDTEMLSIARRLQAGACETGIQLALTGPKPASRKRGKASASPSFHFTRLSPTPSQAESYQLNITTKSVTVEYADRAGLRAAGATLRQLLREHGRYLPCLTIRDWPDFPRRGVMLDVSRGRVPTLKTLFGLADHLADFKINEFQLYFEHTFAYRNYRPVWRGWGALTAEEIRKLDGHCRELGIDLVPNQNSFGHLRQWLQFPPLKKLAEVPGPYESDDGTFLRFPSTLAPNHPGTLRFLRELYDELLPNFTSRYFNVGCDETWDLGLGQSKALCEMQGPGRVYLSFLKAIRREVAARGRQMMFWGDIILNHPKLIRGLPKDLVALNWGYEADHPFDRESAAFARAGLRFYVCPGTSTWMTLIGRHDNALANLHCAAKAGRRHGAEGYLITDWGDGGHPQPLAVSYLPYLAGAALSWCGQTFDEKLLLPVLNRDIFCDPTQRLAPAALALGRAHLRFGYGEPNSSPYGTTLAAPPAGVRELPCRNGLRNYLHIPARRVQAGLRAVEKQLAEIRKARPSTPSGKVLARELELAARMAAESCQVMSWQRAVAAGDRRTALRLARRGIRELTRLEHDFEAYWPLRNKGSMKKCAAFLRWRRHDYETRKV